MHWNKSEDSKKKYFETEFKDLESVDIGKLLNEILGIVNETHGGSWAVFKCEIWPETGHLIFYPAQKPVGFRDEKVAFRLTVQKIMDDYLTLEDTAEEDEDRFEDELEKMMLHVSNVICTHYAEVDHVNPIYVCDSEQEKLN